MYVYMIKISTSPHTTTISTRLDRLAQRRDDRPPHGHGPAVGRRGDAVTAGAAVCVCLLSKDYVCVSLSLIRDVYIYNDPPTDQSRTPNITHHTTHTYIIYTYTYTHKIPVPPQLRDGREVQHRPRRSGLGLQPRQRPRALGGEDLFVLDGLVCVSACM